MNSFHIIASKDSGGAERFYVRLVLALAERGHTTVSVNRPSSFVSSALKSPVRQLHVPMRNNFDFLSLLRISAAIRHRSPDVVMTYMSRASWLTRLLRTSDAVHIARLGGYYKLKYFRHADAWVANTKGLCDYLVREGLGAEKVHFIPNFVDTTASYSGDFSARARRSLKIPEDALVIMAPGRFIRKKGFDVLISACARLPRTVQGREVRLLLVGDGKERDELETHASRVGMGDRISFPGWQADPDPYYEIADVVAFPSRFEPYGNVIKETWAHGKALVSTKTLGAEELLEDGRTGLLVPVEDEKAIAEALLRVLKDEGLRKGLGDAGCERVRNHYSKDVIVDRYVELFEDLRSRR
jgi:glycosyltransferase involved in cell wall biosynthesis